MTENEKQVEKKTDKPNLKTPYSRPQLVIYGDIQEITLGSKNEGSRDNAGSSASNYNKTGYPSPTPKPNQTPSDK